MNTLSAIITLKENDLMANRYELEANLTEQIKKMQVQFNQDSKVREMILELRKIYRHNPTEAISVLNNNDLVNQNTQRLSSNMPQSRIPHLIYLLNEIAKKNTELLSSNKPKRQTEFPTFNPEHHENSKKSTIQAHLKLTHELQTIQSQIKVLLMEISKLQELLELFRQDQPAILNRHGKYRSPLERLRAERMLRELPGAIIHKQEKISQLKQELEKKKG